MITPKIEGSVTAYRHLCDLCVSTINDFTSTSIGNYRNRSQFINKLYCDYIEYSGVCKNLPELNEFSGISSFYPSVTSSVFIHFIKKTISFSLLSC